MSTSKLNVSSFLASSAKMETVFARNITIRILDSTAVSIFVVILVELTNTVFVNSTNITTNIGTAALSRVIGQRGDWSQLEAKVKVKRNVCVCRVWDVGQRPFAGTTKYCLIWSASKD